MDLSLKTEVYGAEDQSWLGSEHGTDSARTVTLSPEHIPTSNRHVWIPSGLPLGRVTATGLYGQYDPEAENGLEVLAGFLLSSLPGPKSSDQPIIGALFEHGKVRPDRLPVALSEDAFSHVQGRIIFYTRPGVGSEA